jgi:porin
VESLTSREPGTRDFIPLIILPICRALSERPSSPDNEVAKFSSLVDPAGVTPRPPYTQWICSLDRAPPPPISLSCAQAHTTDQGRAKTVNKKTTMPTPLLTLLLLLAAPGLTQEDAKNSTEGPPQVVQTITHQGLLPLRKHGGPLDERLFLSGDWGGKRDQMTEAGIRYDIIWTQVLQSVESGGVNPSTEYGGKLDIPINFDLDRMGILPGALFTFRTESKHGSSVNRDTGGLLAANDVHFFPLTDGEEDLLLAITEFRYTQFLSKRLGLFLGKIIALGGDVNEFAGGRGDTQFLSHSFLASSVTALINPYSAPGAGVFWMPNEDVTVTTSIYTSNDASTSSGLDELDEGLTWSTAVRNQYKLNALPGGMNLAFQYAFDGNFTDIQGQFVDGGVLSVPSNSESWNAFWNIWQYLSVDGPGDQRVDATNGRTDLRGTGFFARAGLADQDTNPVEWSLSLGLAGRGLHAGRPDDTFGIGYARSQIRENLLTDSFLVDDTSQRWEAYYSFALTPAVGLTLSAQILDPLLETVDTATVFGFRLRTSF